MPGEPDAISRRAGPAVRATRILGEARSPTARLRSLAQANVAGGPVDLGGLPAPTCRRRSASGARPGGSLEPRDVAATRARSGCRRASAASGDARRSVATRPACERRSILISSRSPPSVSRSGRSAIQDGRPHMPIAVRATNQQRGAGCCRCRRDSAGRQIVAAETPIERSGLNPSLDQAGVFLYTLPKWTVSRPPAAFAQRRRQSIGAG